jgi:hypothetical protein
MIHSPSESSRSIVCSNKKIAIGKTLKMYLIRQKPPGRGNSITVPGGCSPKFESSGGPGDDLAAVVAIATEKPDDKDICGRSGCCETTTSQ